MVLRAVEGEHAPELGHGDRTEHFCLPHGGATAMHERVAGNLFFFSGDRGWATRRETRRKKMQDSWWVCDARLEGGGRRAAAQGAALRGGAREGIRGRR